MTSSYNERLIICFTLIILLCWCNFFILLGDKPINSWDEARHGVSAYEMIHSGNYLVQTYNGSIDYWNAKPPLSFWTIAAGFKLFGFTPLGLRITSAICSSITIIMIFIFAWHRLSWVTGLLACGMLANLNSFVFDHNARTGDADALFITLSTGAVLCALQSKEKNLFLYLSSILLSLAFLSKSFHVISPAMTVFVLIIWVRGCETFRLKHLLLFVLCGLAPVLVWGYARYLHDGPRFFVYMIGYDLIKRSRNVIEGHYGSPFYYLSVIKENFSWSFLFLVSLLLFIALKNRKILKSLIIEQDNILILQICFCTILPTLLFSFAASKLYWYIYPVFPFLSLLFAQYIYTSIRILSKLFLQHKNFIFALVVFFYCYQESRTLIKVVKESHKSSLVQNILHKASKFNKYGDNIPVYLESMRWKQSFVLAAKLYGNFQPRDGGRQSWAKDISPGAILITNKLGIQQK